MATNSRAPVSRWDATAAKGLYTSAAYGAFVVHGAFMSDAAAFGISKTEARGLDPVAGLVLQTSYAMFLGSLPKSKHQRCHVHVKYACPARDDLQLVVMKKHASQVERWGRYTLWPDFVAIPK